jgi:hypothetical protein
VGRLSLRRDVGQALRNLGERPQSVSRGAGYDLQ